MSSRAVARRFLIAGVVIFAASNAIVRKLTVIGGEHLIDGRNPISFCNVLFAGNLCAGLVLAAIYRKQWDWRMLRDLSLRTKFGLASVAVLSGALAPSLIFTALDRTSVNSVVLIGRLEPPLALALAVVFLRAEVNRWVITGAAVSFCGVMLTVLIPGAREMMASGDMMKAIGPGEIYAALGAITLAVSAVLTKVSLRDVPLGIFSIVRTASGVVIFFIVVIALYGPGHFMDVGSPFLWQWMVLYGGVIVVAGQLLWFRGLQSALAPDISFASGFSPLAGVAAAALVLGESPTTAQYIGGAVILLGIVLSQIGVTAQAQGETRPDQATLIACEKELGLKGV